MLDKIENAMDTINALKLPCSCVKPDYVCDNCINKVELDGLMMDIDQEANKLDTLFEDYKKLHKDYLSLIADNRKLEREHKKLNEAYEQLHEYHEHITRRAL